MDEPSNLSHGVKKASNVNLAESEPNYLSPVSIYADDLLDPGQVGWSPKEFGLFGDSGELSDLLPGSCFEQLYGYPSRFPGDVEDANASFTSNINYGPKLYEDYSILNNLEETLGRDGACPLGLDTYDRYIHKPEPQVFKAPNPFPMNRLTPPQTAEFERRPGHGRKQSISKMCLSELYHHMRLSNDHDEAQMREQRIMDIVQEQGFEVGRRTWIRDTDEEFRRLIIDELYRATFSEYGYDKKMLETIVRRGTYARMQRRLRKFRRSRAAA